MAQIIQFKLAKRKTREELILLSDVCQHIINTEEPSFKLVIPNTDPPMYVVVGTKEDCLRMLNEVSHG